MKAAIEIDEEQPQNEMGTSQNSRTGPSSGTVAQKRKEIFFEEKAHKHVRGSMDTFVRRTPKNVIDERWSKEASQTTLENRMRSEDERHKLRSYFARWAYESGVLFNALKSKRFHILVEAIGQYGPGFKPPSMHDYRVSLLKTEMEAIKEIKEKHQTAWRKYGCTLMSDGWTDKRGAGVGAGFPGLQVGAGIGAGCGIGFGFGYGLGRGIAYDESRRYSNIGKLFRGNANLPSHFQDLNVSFEVMYRMAMLLWMA
ncbi:hypothetical protein KSP39_PZI020075 [Platanthera zijinensis]|uniref:DUF659 domain-containing protein n=1 Tax=Platanthera zijinensis TaxID=2320716 RepID=A0AAP0AZG6_9ASPA